MSPVIISFLYSWFITFFFLQTSQFKKIETKAGRMTRARSHSNPRDDADHNNDTTARLTASYRPRPARSSTVGTRGERNVMRNLKNDLTDFKHGESLGAADEKEAETSRSDTSNKSPTSAERPQKRREPRIAINHIAGETASNDKKTKQI
mmetsp:Transcript_12138/g.19426  ORF Transcript_12138/g.19426 Transcript_12138/m.19426 type:complete len:150 (-) Transcript_12138:280-729(-)